MNPLKSLSLTICFLFLAHLSWTQEASSPGYIVNIDGDTVKGNVTYQARLRTLSLFQFQPQGSNEVSSYTAKDIPAFGYDNKNYLSAILNIENSFSRKTSKPRMITDTVFVELLTIGVPALGLYRDEKDVENYFTIKENKVQLLVYRVFEETDADGKMMQVVQNMYRDQLKAHFNGCATINKKIQKTAYNYNSLVKLFNSYYTCSGVATVQQGTKEKNPVRFGVLAGVTNTAMQITEHTSVPLSMGPVTKSTDLTAGLFLEFDIPRTLNKLSLNNELLYTSFEMNSSHRSNETDFYTETSSKLAASYLKLNTAFRYKFLISRVTAFINLGMTNGTAIKVTNNSLKDVIRNGITESSETSTAVGSFRKYETGYLFGTGARVSRYSLEARIEKSNGMSSFSNVTTQVKRLSLLFGYEF